MGSGFILLSPWPAPSLFRSTTLIKAWSAQVADTLHRMVEQLAWAEAEAARRQPVLEAIAQLDQARTECVWLATYEADSDRYKVSPSCPCA